MNLSLSLVSEIVSCGHQFIPVKRNFIPHHLHHFHQLDIVLSGKVIIQLEQKRNISLKTATALLIPPLVSHSYISSEGCEHATMKFYIAACYWSLFEKAQCINLSPGIMQCLHVWGKRQDRKAPLADQQASILASQCLIEILDHSSKSKVKLDPQDPFRLSLLPLLERIANRPYETWSVAQMARECHFSTDHFSKCFHKILERTPRQYLLEIRLQNAARDLLQEPSLPIKDIAANLKYGSVHAFSRAFKASFGISPAAYRKTNIESL